MEKAVVSGPLRHLLAAIAAYGFFPAFHRLIYLPLIVPALRSGERFPWFPTLFAFVLVVLCLGAACSPVFAAVHAVALALSIHGLSWYFGARLEPGYLKETEGPYLAALRDEALTRVVPIAVMLFLVMLAGRGARRSIVAFLNAGSGPSPAQ